MLKYPHEINIEFLLVTDLYKLFLYGDIDIHMKTLSLVGLRLNC